MAGAFAYRDVRLHPCKRTPRVSPVPSSAACSRRRSTTCIHAGVFPDQKARSAIAHLKAALAYYRRLGVTVKRVMTDTVAEPAEAMGRAIPRTPWFGQAHQPSPPPANSSASNTSEQNPIRPEPMARPNASSKPPCVNGPTCLQQAGARAYLTSTQRAQDLPLWTHRYNWHRPHSGIKQQTPISHLNLNQNNLLRLQIYHLHPCSRAFTGATTGGIIRPVCRRHAGASL